MIVMLTMISALVVKDGVIEKGERELTTATSVVATLITHNMINQSSGHHLLLVPVVVFP